MEISFSNTTRATPQTKEGREGRREVGLVPLITDVVSSGMQGTHNMALTAEAVMARGSGDRS